MTDDHVMSEEEQAQVRSMYYGIKRRELPGGSKLPVDPTGECGELKRLTISPDPPEAPDWISVYRKDTCPVCGAAAETSDRQPASLEPNFASGLSFLIPVWVHRMCLDQCPESNDQRGIPW